MGISFYKEVSKTEKHLTKKVKELAAQSNLRPWIKLPRTKAPRDVRAATENVAKSSRVCKPAAQADRFPLDEKLKNADGVPI